MPDDLNLNDGFGVSLLAAGDQDSAEFRVADQDSGVTVDLDLNAVAMRKLHSWLGEALGLNPQAASQVPIIGRIELVLKQP